MYTTDLYFEAHVTIDPVASDNEEWHIATLASEQGFRVAEFLYKKSGRVANPDSFMTTRSKDWLDIVARTTMLVSRLIEYGYTVRRYKIENTLLDVRL